MHCLFLYLFLYWYLPLYIVLYLVLYFGQYLTLYPIYISISKFYSWIFIVFYIYRYISIWVRSRNCGWLVTWFCYQLIAKPGNKTAAVSWPDPYTFNSNSSSIVSWIYPVHHPVQYDILYLVLYLYQVLYLVLYLILYLAVYLGLYPALALSITKSIFQSLSAFLFLTTSVTLISIISLYNYTYATSNIMKMFQQKGWFRAADM